MPRNSRKSTNDPNPLYALAGAGDLAVEKIREISKIASERINSLETTDPAAVSDRVQERIEERADALAVALRSASSDLRIQAKGLGEKAQAAVQTVLIQAGDTYETLAKRGKGAVVRIRSQQNGGSNGGRTLNRSNSSTSSRSSSTGTRSSSTGTRSSSTGTKSGSSSSRSASGSSRSSSSTSRPKAGTTKKRASTKGRGGSAMAGTRKATRSATDGASSKPSTTAKSDAPFSAPAAQPTATAPKDTSAVQQPSTTAFSSPSSTPKDTAAKKSGPNTSAT